MVRVVEIHRVASFTVESDGFEISVIARHMISSLILMVGRAQRGSRREVVVVYLFANIRWRHVLRIRVTLGGLASWMTIDFTLGRAL